jgi:hypothetical protein
MKFQLIKGPRSVFLNKLDSEHFEINGFWTNQRTEKYLLQRKAKRDQPQGICYLLFHLIVMCLFNDRDLNVRCACYLIRIISRAFITVDCISGAVPIIYAASCLIIARTAVINSYLFT